MKVVNLKTSEIKEYEQNSNIHPKEQVKKLVDSIKQFGFNVPILVDSNKTIIAGHARLMAAKELGLEKVPTICISHLSEAQKKAFIIADNRIAQDSGLDFDILSKEYEYLLNNDSSVIDSIGLESSDILKIQNILNFEQTDAYTEDLADQEAAPDMGQQDLREKPLKTYTLQIFDMDALTKLKKFMKENGGYVHASNSISFPFKAEKGATSGEIA